MWTAIHWKSSGEYDIKSNNALQDQGYTPSYHEMLQNTN